MHLRLIEASINYIPNAFIYIDTHNEIGLYIPYNDGTLMLHMSTAYHIEYENETNGCKLFTNGEIKKVELTTEFMSHDNEKEQNFTYMDRNNSSVGWEITQILYVNSEKSVHHTITTIEIYTQPIVISMKIKCQHYLLK